VNLSVRKPLVIDYKLPYPTGTATGVMINSFFTNGEFGPPSLLRPARNSPAGWLGQYSMLLLTLDSLRPRGSKPVSGQTHPLRFASHAARPGAW